MEEENHDLSRFVGIKSREQVALDEERITRLTSSQEQGRCVKLVPPTMFYHIFITSIVCATFVPDCAVKIFVCTPFFRKKSYISFITSIACASIFNNFL